MEAEHHNHSNKPSRVTRAKIVRPVNKDEGKITAGLSPWHHPSSRIFRVSRASGGKDRHSKVYTSKGLRDRRVRLSVSTAIQFYDLQDRLGYDQPSKAIEWLIKKASAAIVDLPSLEGTYEHLKLEEKPEVGHEVNQLDEMPQQHDCSSTSETSKGSDHQAINSSLNPPDSFTELLTSNGASGIQKPIPYMPGYASPIGMVPFNITAPETQHLSLLQDHQIPIAAYAAGDYNFNFAISPGVAGFNRGTLQSNSRPQLPYHLLQRFSSPVERSSLPFFFGASAAAATSAEQLCFGDGLRHSDMKGKGKS